MIDPKQVLSQLNDTNAQVAIQYHRGLLAADLKDCSNGLTLLQKKALAELATDLLRLAETGAIHLVQRRHGPGDFSYYAIKGGTQRLCGNVHWVDRSAGSHPPTGPAPIGAERQ